MGPMSNGMGRIDKFAIFTPPFVVKYAIPVSLGDLGETGLPISPPAQAVSRFQEAAFLIILLLYDNLCMNNSSFNLPVDLVASVG
jgi:hypothetical protein